MKDVIHSGRTGVGLSQTMKEQYSSNDRVPPGTETSARVPRVRWEDGENPTPSDRRRYETSLVRTFELLDQRKLSQYVRCLEAYGEDADGEISCIAVLEPSRMKLMSTVAFDTFFRDFNRVQLELWTELGSTEWRVLATQCSDNSSPSLQSSDDQQPRRARVTAEK